MRWRDERTSQANVQRTPASVKQYGSFRDNAMTRTSLTRVVALLSIVLLLGASAAEAGHHHEEDDARHDCVFCAAGSLTPCIGAHSAPSACPTAVCSLPPGPQGPPLCAPYRDCLPSRAPPVPA